MSKICPACHKSNEDNAFFCDACGAEIAAVRPADHREMQQDRSASHTKKSRTPPSSPKVCPYCRHSNPGYAVLCVGCGTKIESEPTGDIPLLFLEIEGMRYDCREGEVLGREGTIARTYFAEFKTVSRRHLKLILISSAWHVEIQPGVKNSTIIDEREISREHPTRLRGAHTVKLSTQCAVRLIVQGKE